MKTIISFASVVATTQASEVSPLEKTIQLLSDLEAKVIKEGETSQAEYEEYSEWCETRSKDIGFEIKTGKATVEELQATILSEKSSSEELTAKIDDLAGSIATDTADLKAATEIREKEHANFVAEENELSSTIDMIERAIAVLEKEMNGGASMMQLQGVSGLQQALAVMVKASAISNADAVKLSSFAQTHSTDDDTDDDSGAPDAEVYENHSGGIIDTLNGLLEQATSQLDEIRGTETNNKNNFEMLKQSLTDDVKYATKDKADATKALAESGETKASAEGDLGVSQKDLAEDIKDLAELHQECMARAQDFEAEVSSRGEELKALAQAKKAITDMSQGAGSISYDFLQLNRVSIRTRKDLGNLEAVRYVKELARKQKDASLAQLASRMSTVMRLSADPFEKIKGLITDMINRLEQEAAEAADLKDWCDKEFGESNAKKDDATAENDKLTSKIDFASARSKKLKEECATLQKELAELATAQAQMDDLRAEQKATYDQERPELEMGLKGVKLALKILNDYYSKEGKSHDSADGAASGIIGMLEVIESDFSKNLAQVEAAEEAAADAYERETKENAVTKTTKSQDLKYKTKESNSLDKKVSELTTDREGVQAELDAVNEYLDSLKKKCTYKVETYAERVSRRQAEIDGLKEALRVLEEETAFIQKTSTLRSLRGTKRHA